MHRIRRYPSRGAAIHGGRAIAVRGTQRQHLPRKPEVSTPSRGRDRARHSQRIISRLTLVVTTPLARRSRERDPSCRRNRGLPGATQ